MPTLRVVALLTMSISAATAGPLGPVTDLEAYAQAKASIIEANTTKHLGDLEGIWHASLRKLGLSPDALADELLSDLALFSLDGALGEEFSCAAGSRGKNFSRWLAKRLVTFETSNMCVVAAKQHRLNPRSLCASKKEFSRLVRTYRNLPMKDSGESACDY